MLKKEKSSGNFGANTDGFDVPGYFLMPYEYFDILAVQIINTIFKIGWP